MIAMEKQAAVTASQVQGFYSKAQSTGFNNPSYPKQGFGG